MFRFRINTNKPISQTDILIDIERLVSYAMRNQTILRQLSDSDFTMRQNNPFDESFYQGFCAAWSWLLSAYDQQYSYSELIEAFWYGCCDLGLFSNLHWSMSMEKQILPLTRSQIIALLCACVTYTQDRSFMRRAHDRLYEMRIRHIKVTARMRALIRRYPKLLVVRVNLAYHEQYQHLITFDLFHQHFNRFLRAQVQDELYQYQVNRIWAIEQGQDLGYHVHALFCFDGNKCQRDLYYAKEMGELWKSVTNGMGYSHNSNAKKAEFEAKGRRGVGMIHRHDPVACENAVRSAGYLVSPTKKFQHVRMRRHKNRLFAMSKIPVRRRKHL